MIRLELQGDKALEKKLRTLEVKVAKKVVRPAVRKAMKPTLTDAKENARTMIGGALGKLMAASLILRAFRRQRRGSYGVNVRLKSGVSEFRHKAKDGTEYYVPAAVEYGHDSAAAIPAMRNAFEKSKQRAQRILQDEIWAGIKRLVGTT